MMIKKIMFFSIFSLLSASSISHASQSEKEDLKNNRPSTYPSQIQNKKEETNKIVTPNSSSQPSKSGRDGNSNGGTQTGQTNVSVNKDINCAIM